MRLQRLGSSSIWEWPLVDAGIWLVVLVAIAATLTFSLGPKAPGEGVDKGMHATAYFVDTLAILLALVWRPGQDKRGFEWALWIALVILAAGGVIELAQGGFVHRDAQFADWMADAVGIGLAVLVFAVARKVFGGSRSTAAGYRLARSTPPTAPTRCASRSVRDTRQPYGRRGSAHLLGRGMQRGGATTDVRSGAGTGRRPRAGWRSVSRISRAR